MTKNNNIIFTFNEVSRETNKKDEVSILASTITGVKMVKTEAKFERKAIIYTNFGQSFTLDYSFQNLTENQYLNFSNALLRLASIMDRDFDTQLVIDNLH